MTLTITLTLLTLILDIGLSKPRIIEPSDYRYITLSAVFLASTSRVSMASGINFRISDNHYLNSDFTNSN